MKRCFTLFLVTIFCLSISAIDIEHNTKQSSVGISVSSIKPQYDGSYNVEFYNSNSSDRDDDTIYRTSFMFDWYLSYKGKRVSDYRQTTVRCRRSCTETIWAWPGEVPNGHESYVTVQFGRERKQKDRRDDY